MIVEAPQHIDPGEARRALLALFADSPGRMEIRAGHAHKINRSRTGTPDQLDALVDQAEAFAAEGLNVYYCLNPIRLDFRDRRGGAVKDGDIAYRRLLMIDVDSKRPDADRPATDEQALAAREGSRRIARELAIGFNFPKPVAWVDSGNGAQLVYRCALPNDDESTELVKAFLKALGRVFGPALAGCSIDPSVSNASRLARLPGTLNIKPKADDDHPPRWATILGLFEDAAEVTAEQLRDVIDFAAELAGPEPEPEPAKPSRNGNRTSAEADADHARRYVLSALAGECDKIAKTVHPHRHNQIRSSAIALGGFLDSGAVTREEMLDALVQAGEQCGKTAEQARGVAAWGLDQGKGKPRTIPLREQHQAEGKVKAKGVTGDEVTVDLPDTSWRIDARKASTYKARPLKFLSKPRLPRGIVITLGGAGGEGKSTLTEHVAADLSRGRPTLGSDVPFSGPVDVLMLACEDGREDALIPRLIAAEADLDRIEIIEGLRNSKGDYLPFDITFLPYLRRHIEDGLAEGRNYKLVIIDPITTYVGRAKIDDHRDAQLKPAMAELAKIAQELDVTFICLAHLNKGGSGKSAAFRIMGGAAYVTSSRLTYIYAADPDAPDRRILASPKANIPGGKPPSLAIRIAPIGQAEALGLLAPHTEHLAPEDRLDLASQLYRLAYDGSVETTAEQALDSNLSKGDRKDKARDFLLEILAEGRSIPSNTIYAEGKKAGVSRSAIWDAKNEMDIAALKLTEDGKTAWYWRLNNPEGEPAF